MDKDRLFYCVSRILNKLTPDKFDKLSLELLNVGIDTQLILKGIILLVSISRIYLNDIFSLSPRVLGP